MIEPSPTTGVYVFVPKSRLRLEGRPFRKVRIYTPRGVWFHSVLEGLEL